VCEGGRGKVVSAGKTHSKYARAAAVIPTCLQKRDIARGGGDEARDGGGEGAAASAAAAAAARPPPAAAAAAVEKLSLPPPPAAATTMLSKHRGRGVAANALRQKTLLLHIAALPLLGPTNRRAAETGSLCSIIVMFFEEKNSKKGTSTMM
jgi:hypothetical protein